MTLFIEIDDGPKQGTRLRVQDGLIIGRRKGDLTIEDSKLSSRHAKIEERPGPEFWLVDLGSSNGIKSEAGERVTELRLNTGTSFILGRTRLKVVEAEEALQDPPLAQSGATITRTFWDGVRELAERAEAATQGAPLKKVTALHRPLRLAFTRGIQTGSEWFVGYGPRTAGASSIDLHLEEPSLPAVCFKLVPDENGVRFVNSTESEVRLNGKWVKEATLRHGDVIDILNTQIQVRFDDGK